MNRGSAREGGGTYKINSERGDQGSEEGGEVWLRKEKRNSLLSQRGVSLPEKETEGKEGGGDCGSPHSRRRSNSPQFS